MILQAFPKLNENHNQDTSLFKVQSYNSHYRYCGGYYRA